MAFFFATQLYVYLMIPISAGLIGYITNVLAIKMMFYPIEFVGKRPVFGWQGIIPSKAQKLAEDVTIRIDGGASHSRVLAAIVPCHATVWRHEEVGGRPKE